MLTHHTVLEGALICLDVLPELLPLDQMLKILEMFLDSILSYDTILAQNLIDASEDHIITSLFTVADLLHLN